MARIDENQEAIARIRMAVDDDDKARARQAKLGTDDGETISREPEQSKHWSFGSPSGTRLNSRALERNLAATDHNYASFDERLRCFITETIPEEAPRYEDSIYVCSS